MDAENENIIFFYILLFNNWQSQLLSFSTLGSDESFGDASWIKIFHRTKIFMSIMQAPGKGEGKLVCSSDFIVQLIFTLFYIFCLWSGQARPLFIIYALPCSWRILKMFGRAAPPIVRVNYYRYFYLILLIQHSTIIRNVFGV